MTNVVLYHDDADGFGAAYAIWKYDRAQGRVDDRLYIPVNHGQPVPPLPEDTRSLFVVDFSYDRATCDALFARYPDFLVLDHHKTAKDTLEDAIYARFDMNKSGAVLAWQYFHQDAPIPALLAYVQDRDLWRWALPQSEEVSLYLHTLPRCFDLWDKFDLQQAKIQGSAIKQYKDQLLEDIAKHAFATTFDGHPVVAVTTPVLTSELGNLLCRRHPEAAFAVMVNSQDPRLPTKVSLRSVGAFDVSAIAKNHGGGGHRNAAGFECAAEF